MTINKFQGKTQEEAIEKAKKELGSEVVVMSVREIKPQGFFRMFKKSTFEVTAAIEEKDPYVAPPRPPIPAAVKQEEKPIEAKSVEAKTMEAKPMEEKPSEMPKEELKEEIKEENKEEFKEERPNALTAEAFDFVRILYKQLIDNEVNEKYANQILEEVEQFIRPGASVDMILANVYQKLILRFGRPEPLEVEKGKTKVVFFIGPTGVGKTTTIAKIASRFKVEQNDPIAFITSDTYRIAAPEQLRVYANILDVPMSVVYSAEELNDTLDKMRDYALVFVDTAGFSHRNEAQRGDISKLIKNLDPEWDKEVYLVVSATTKYRDLLDIVDIYSEISDFKLIFTKLDETSAYGNLLNIKLYSGAELSYMTTGQNVPDDIELFNIQKIVKQILGGR
jgi:flagellar biosynthesis protein FlhF